MGTAGPFFCGKSSGSETFVLPKIVYPLTMLQNPDLETMEQIKYITTTFYGIPSPTKYPEYNYSRLSKWWIPKDRY